MFEAAARSAVSQTRRAKGAEEEAAIKDEGLPVAARSRLVIVFCCLAALSEGFELQLPGVTLPTLSHVFALSTGHDLLTGFFSEKSLFLSMSTFGLMIGAPIGGWLADRYGRKGVVVVSLAAFGIFSILTGLVSSADALLTARFLTGIGLGGAMPVLFTIAVETARPGQRGAAVGLLYSSLPVGGMLVALVSIALANEQQWRLIYYLGGILAFLAAAGLILVLPRTTTGRASTSEHGDRAALFREGRLGPTLGLWLGYIAVMAGSYMLMSWLPSLLLAKGLPSFGVFVVQIGFAGFGVVGSFVTGALLDRCSRSSVIMLTYLAMAAALIALAFLPADIRLAFLASAAVGFLLSGASVALYTLAAACYPASVRGRGVGLGVSAGRVGSAMGPLIAGAMLGGGFAPSVIVAALIPLLLLGGGASLFVDRRLQMDQHRRDD